MKSIEGEILFETSCYKSMKLKIKISFEKFNLVQPEKYSIAPENEANPAHPINIPLGPLPLAKIAREIQPALIVL